MIRNVLAVVPLAAALACAAAVSAQQAAPDEPPAVSKERIASALALTQSEAAKYEITLVEDEKSIAALQKEPVLKWSDPTVGEIHGNVFLWTIDERPVAVGSLFKWLSPHTHMSHEFHSLTEMPLAARYERREVWRTSKGGLTFAPVPGAEQPAGTENRRSLQMRDLAKGFAATKTDRNGDQTVLRLLPRPAYRYASPKQDVLDGGLFVLVQGTDPEVFVLLEARGKGDKAQWMFAATRMNSVGFELRFQDKPIWSAEIMPWRDVGSHAEPYTSFMFKMP
jgi:hypothetical protein